ncbi:T9SS type A sorting domain-containing protein [Flavobacterium sp. H4147]|uniref:T9SS type A sorting domain-containing protein n=1 Tax=Flavobacterium sp. H4147 TaxID=3034149 RepID=UPI0023EB4E20|nr:T9SS type A sorting domain-containing protein [Flavobacterium sp. H4147]
MRKKYNYLFLLFFITLGSFAQKVTLIPTTVNGNAFNGTSVNLGGTPYSTVALSVRVEMPTIPGNTGTVTVYTVSGLTPTISIGGSSTMLFFGEGKTATQSFVINIDWNSISTSGGQIYAEYKTPGGVVYKSSYVPVTKSATMNGGVNPPADAPDPAKITNTLCCNQTVRLGDRPTPITGSQYLNPYQGKTYGISASWEANGNPSVRFLNVDNANKVLTFDYIAELKNFTVTRSLGYAGTSTKPNKSNAVTITVLPSPILTNTITTNDTPNSDGIYELSSVKTLNLYGFTSMINLNMLQDPNHINQRGDDVVRVDSYKWEYKNTSLDSNPWITIPNENNADINFSATLSQASNSEDINYSIRRIAIYKNISRVSNELKILVRGLRFNNTICCDQILKIQSETSFENPKIITGSTAGVDSPIEAGDNFAINSLNYQWQSQNIQGGNSISVWADIPNATSKDYFPSQPLTVVSNMRNPRYAFQTTYRYRRITKINYSIVTNRLINRTVSSYSNEVSLDGTASVPFIQIYPNPTSSTLNIECTVDISDAKVTVSNIMGNTVNSNNYSILNSKLININVASLPAGTYFITIENQNLGIAQKTFIKQ